MKKLLGWVCALSFCLNASAENQTPRNPRGPWRVGLAAGFGDLPYRTDNMPPMEEWHFSAAELIQADYRFSPSWSIKGTIGIDSLPQAGTRNILILGGDLEFVPVQAYWGSPFPVLELGLLGGFSNLMNATGAHHTYGFNGGFRISYSLGAYIWFTSALRFNLKYVMAEGGILVNL